MDILLVVDMQEGLRIGAPKHELSAVVERINALAKRIRQRDGAVFFVQHAGPTGDDFEPGSAGWQFLAGLEVDPRDLVIGKSLNDAFFRTVLLEKLGAVRADRVLIAGWATNLCVDATVRSAVAFGYNVVVVTDGHTVSDRPHLNAEQVIRHHHWLWANLLAPRPVRFARAADI